MSQDDSNNDYLQFAQQSASAEGELSQLSALAEQQKDAEDEVKRLTEELDKAKDVVRDFAERQVPELMDKIGIAEFKTATGLTIEVAETIRAGITVENGPKAFAWLRDNDHSALIKRVLKLEFGKGQDDDAEATLKELEGKGLDVDDKTTVNPQTLGAFVREKLQAGEEIPLELLGVHRQRVAKIKLEKPKGKKK